MIKPELEIFNIIFSNVPEDFKKIKNKLNGNELKNITEYRNLEEKNDLYLIISSSKGNNTPISIVIIT